MTRVTTIHFSWSTTHAKCNNQTSTTIRMRNGGTAPQICMAKHFARQSECGTEGVVLYHNRMKKIYMVSLLHRATINDKTASCSGNNGSLDGFFCERELAITFAICCRPSVCRLSVTLARRTQVVEIFGNFYAIWYLGDPLTST